MTPKRALWIDDDEATVETATQLLERRGVDVVGFSRSGEGLQRLRSDDEAAIVITDIRLPDLDRVEVLTIASAVHAAGRPFAIFVLTGHATSDDEERAIELGADLFRQKPIDLADLPAQIRQRPPAPSRSVGERREKSDA